MERRGPYRRRTLEERLRIHQQVRELHSKGLPPKEIGRVLNISRKDASYWLRVDRPSRSRYAPDLSPTPELAYLTGAYLGDGCTAGYNDKKVKFRLADASFAKILNELIVDLLKAAPKSVTLELGFYCVSYDSAALYDYLQEPVDTFSPLIEAFPGRFLRGFFDAEGYSSPILDHSHQLFRGITVGFVNTNVQYLELVKRTLARLRMETHARLTHKKGDAMTIRGETFLRKHDVFHLLMTRHEDVRLFDREIGFSIPEKRDKLTTMIQILDSSSPDCSYGQFLSKFERRNRKWFLRR